MFKAKLIEKESFYKLKREQILYMFIPSILIGLLINFYALPIWLIIILVVIYLLLLFLTSKNLKQINAITGNKTIEIKEEEISIKNNNNGERETIHLNHQDKIILKANYALAQETIAEIGKELSGQAKENYLILEQNTKQRRLDFEIETHYMIEQLNKVIQVWEEKGFNIEKV